LDCAIHRDVERGDGPGGLVGVSTTESKTLDLEEVERFGGRRAGRGSGIDGNMAQLVGGQASVGRAISEGKQHGRGAGQVGVDEGEVGEEEIVVGGEGGG